jgi:secreted Zn-dependent insulinase-like peptidase
MLSNCLQTPAAYASPESAVCVRLLVKLLGDYLNEAAYPAELAGLSYSITNHLAGFQVRRRLGKNALAVELLRLSR